jgi:hypothetical protein
MATRGTISIPEHTLVCPLRLNGAYALILLYLYRIISLRLLASVMSGNKLEEGVKSAVGKFLFSLRRPDFLWAYTTSYPPSPGTHFYRGKLAWHKTEHFFAIRFCRGECLETESNSPYLFK